MQSGVLLCFAASLLQIHGVLHCFAALFCCFVNANPRSATLFCCFVLLLRYCKSTECYFVLLLCSAALLMQIHTFRHVIKEPSVDAAFCQAAVLCYLFVATINF
jgi:hypothetical protein